MNTIFNISILGLEDTFKLQNEFKIAGDLYGEGDITLNDLVGIMSKVSGNGTIRRDHIISNSEL